MANKPAPQTAGDRLRDRIQAALAHAEEQRGIPLEYDELDTERIARAATAADDAERLRGLWLEEITGTGATPCWPACAPRPGCWTRWRCGSWARWSAG